MRGVSITLDVINGAKFPRSMTSPGIEPRAAAPHVGWGSMTRAEPRRSDMRDPKSIAEDYIAFWNETDPVARGRLYAEGWEEAAVYVDPMMAGSGRPEIEALVAGVQARFPGFSFALSGAPDGHGEYARFSWRLGPSGAEAPIEGSDVLVMRDGRIARVIGFLDKVPVGP
jgi:hypothetical protein